LCRQRLERRTHLGIGREIDAQHTGTQAREIAIELIERTIIGERLERRDTGRASRLAVSAARRKREIWR
jgi:hypothetical protein